MNNNRKLLTILMAFLMAFSLSSCKGENASSSNDQLNRSSVESSSKNSNDLGSDENGSNTISKIVSKKNSNNEKKTSKTQKIRIKAFGDVMAHLQQVNYAYNISGQSSYDFSRQFEYIKDFASDSDLTIGNFETSVNPDKEPSGYPMFTTPNEYIRDIKNAGFDVLTTANNHSADSGEKGIFDTISYMDQYGVDHVGTHSKDKDRILYKDVKGVKVAILSYTYGINGLESVITENKPEEIINYLDPDLIKKDIEDAKENKADLIICYPHWGNEYESYPSEDQIKLGRNMIDWGANIVIGNHPHVVQPAERYKSKDGREGYIAYSCGNFVSMQSLEGLGDIRTEHSVGFDINVEKNPSDGEIKLGEISFYPIWVGHGYDDYGMYARVYKTDDFLEGGKYYNEVDENQRDRIMKAHSMVTETINTKVE